MPHNINHIIAHVISDIHICIYIYRYIWPCYILCTLATNNQYILNMHSNGDVETLELSEFTVNPNAPKTGPHDFELLKLLGKGLHSCLSSLPSHCRHSLPHTISPTHNLSHTISPTQSLPLISPIQSLPHNLSHTISPTYLSYLSTPHNLSHTISPTLNVFHLSLLHTISSTYLSYLSPPHNFSQTISPTQSLPHNPSHTIFIPLPTTLPTPLSTEISTYIT